MTKHTKWKPYLINGVSPNLSFKHTSFISTYKELICKQEPIHICVQSKNPSICLWATFDNNSSQNSLFIKWRIAYSQLSGTMSQMLLSISKDRNITTCLQPVPLLRHHHSKLTNTWIPHRKLKKDERKEKNGAPL